MQLALEKEKQGLCHVVPVILRHCDWQAADFGGLLASPKDGRPVTDFEDKDKAFADIAISLRKLIEDIVAVKKAATLTEVPKKSLQTKFQYDKNKIYKDGVPIGDVSGAITENDQYLTFDEIVNTPIPDSNQVIVWNGIKLQFVKAHNYSGFQFGLNGAKQNVLSIAVYVRI